MKKFSLWREWIVILFVSFITVVPAQALTLDVNITASTDDAEEVINTGEMDLTDTKLNILSTHIVGLRFNNISIPRGSTITSAYIVFYAHAADSVASNFTIYGQDVDDSLTFAASTSNLSNRLLTSASVSWNPVAVWSNNERGSDTTTPDIHSIMQEIIDRSGWSSGNSLAFILKASTGGREADSYDTAGDYHPYLHIEYELPPLQIGIGDAAVWEHNSGISPISFPVSLNVPITTAVNVNYTFQKTHIDLEDTDTNMSEVVTYTFTIPAGTEAGTEYFVLAGIQGDTIQENNETFNITLTSTSLGSISATDYNATGTIYDDDGANTPPPPTVTSNFNVVHSNYVGLSPASPNGYHYNLPTQIASRADNYKVISLVTGTETLQDSNGSVGVEIVDADSNSSCYAMKPLSDLIWTKFTQQHVIDFTANTIVANTLLQDPDAAKKYYQNAAKNVLFRISYPTTNSGGEIKITEDKPGLFHLEDFPSYAGQSCVNPVTATVYNKNGTPKPQPKTYTQVPEACANAGSAAASSMTEHELFVCFQCIYGAQTSVACSKDNFAIRPEAFYVKQYDLNQTNIAIKQAIADNITGPVSLNLASGYNYYAEVNATNHLNNNAADGYDATESLDAIWEPRTLPLPLAGACDDTNKSAVLNFGLGQATTSLLVDQVGEYRLNITDDTWASVDSNSSLMSHHVSPYFMTATGSDCIINSSVTWPVGTIDLNGCNISTGHDNDVANITYMDHNLTFHPYKFDMSTINFGVGMTPQPMVAGASDFVYISDINRSDGMDMSLRATGNITAKGYDDSNLSNFVVGCYAKPINLTMNSDANLTIPGVPFQYRFQDMNSTGTIIFDSNATNMTAAQFVTLLDGNFTKDMSGSLSTVTRFNFDRNQTTPVDPKTVHYTDFKTACQTVSECTMQADLSTSHEAIGSRGMDFNVTHVYGRIIPRDIRTFGSVPFTASAWYEVFKAPIVNGTSLPPSRNDTNWYTNTLHADLNDGDGNVTVIIPTTPLSLPTNSSSITGMESYQFNAIPLADIPYGGKAHINTDPWLWYGINASDYLDPVNATNLDCLTHPCFNINVVPAVGATGSAKGGAEGNKASKKSDGSGWRSTTDYAPAIR